MNRHSPAFQCAITKSCGRPPALHTLPGFWPYPADSPSSQAVLLSEKATKFKEYPPLSSPPQQNFSKTPSELSNPPFANFHRTFFKLGRWKNRRSSPSTPRYSLVD